MTTDSISTFDQAMRHIVDLESKLANVASRLDADAKRLDQKEDECRITHKMAIRNAEERDAAQQRVQELEAEKQAILDDARKQNEAWGKTQDELVASIKRQDEQAAEIARLREIVERAKAGTWTTADGKVIHKDMPIYVVTDDDGIQVDAIAEPTAESYDGWLVSQCYSTREAAEKARQG